MVGDSWEEATKVLGQQWELAKINPYDGSAIRVRVRTISPHCVLSASSCHFPPAGAAAVAWRSYML